MKTKKVLYTIKETKKGEKRGRYCRFRVPIRSEAQDFADIMCNLYGDRFNYDVVEVNK